MTNRNILNDLRNEVTDESAPLAGLLRKCLFLGIETKSSDLRDWAKLELNGYEGITEIPSYRIFPTPPITASYMSFAGRVSGQKWSRHDLGKAGEHIKPTFSFVNSIEEIEELSKGGQASFIPPELMQARALFNADEENIHTIIDLHYTLAGSLMAGIVGQVRTRLVEIVAELSTEIPLDGLPRKEVVDATTYQNIEAQYITTIGEPSGSVAVGTSANAVTDNGISVDDAFKLIEKIRAEVESLKGSDGQEEIVAVLEDIESDVESGAGVNIEKTNRLTSLAGSLGVTAVTTYVVELTKALAAVAISG
jgi:hypothetical protein